MEFTFISRKVITDSDFKVNSSQANARLMLNTRPNLALKRLPGFQEISSEVNTTIVTASGSLIAQGTLIINPKSTRLSLNQAKALFEQAAVKTGDVFDIYACVHDNQMHLKLVKADATTAAPAPPAPSTAAPKRKRNASGSENAPENVKVARTTSSAPLFDFGAQRAAPVAVATTAPARARASLTVAAPKIDAGAGPLRAKRKNAGMNRRYFGDDYVVDGVEEENITRKKRRKTSVTSDIDVEASAQLTAAAWMAKAPEGPVSSHLMAASDIYRTLGPLSRLAAVAVAIADGGDAMELD
ncbi:hypothetical protein Ndes2526B_g08854 [Nannochloris sp. 'desiccata']|nr:hypothetical protein KSW81_001579 [Chlorella desiccata (nom. nud.)]KAH7616754.1 hypothetical protein NADE_001562 [Chlorella desiccata (nom. nud.)]